MHDLRYCAPDYCIVMLVRRHPVTLHNEMLFHSINGRACTHQNTKMGAGKGNVPCSEDLPCFYYNIMMHKDVGTILNESSVFIALRSL